jgi:glutathione peroxidase
MRKGLVLFMVFSFLFSGGARSQSAQSVYAFKANLITGKEKSLSDYKGKVLLIVNTASGCGFTPQYAALQSLYEKYQSQGLEILAFPSNDFGKQEPGSNQEIAQFCNLRFKVKFPLFEKIDVKGKSIHPLYQYLTSESSKKGSIKWNFSKFLVDRNGNVIDRFAPTTDPLSEKIQKAIQSLL